MIKKPEITPDFTVEDIRKIREYNYELTKDMTVEDRIAFYRNKSNRFMTRLNEKKRLTTHSNESTVAQTHKPYKSG